MIGCGICCTGSPRPKGFKARITRDRGDPYPKKIMGRVRELLRALYQIQIKADTPYEN
jgi:hypothetical protein